MDNLEQNDIDKNEKEHNKQIFAENIIFFRKKLNLSQKELSEKLQVSNKNISKWENAETIPDVFTIKKLANIFNVSIDTLVTPMIKETQDAIKTKKIVPLKLKIYSIILLNAFIFLVACIVFYTLKSINFSIFPPTYIFIYMLPIMTLSIFILIIVIFKKVDTISLSIFGWLLTLCFYLSFKNAENIGYIFIITIGYQILVPVIARLINSRKIIEINKAIISKFKKLEEEKTTNKNQAKK